jgi:sulfur carrier protein ThiS adenylyltransferase
MPVLNRLPDAEFVRYQRQISLPELGEAGQLKLKGGRVLIIGCGGLGTSAALYLAAAGVGKIILADGDVVEESNLQRQVAYRNFDIGTMKATALREQLEELNPDIDIDICCQYLKGAELASLVGAADLVLDCSDNFITRHQVNRVCNQLKAPLISGAATGWTGQLICFGFHLQAAPCYRCLYPFEQNHQPNNCSRSGIVGPVVGIIGSAQALLAIKHLTGAGSMNWSVLHLFEAQCFEWQTLGLVQDPDCPVCAGNKEASHNHHHTQGGAEHACPAE